MQANAIRVEAIKKQQRERRQKIAKTDALIKAARKRYCLRRIKRNSRVLNIQSILLIVVRVLFTLIYIYIHTTFKRRL